MRKKDFVPVLIAMVVIFTVAVFSNNNKEFLKKIGENLKLTNIILKIEAGFSMFGDEDFENTIVESNFEPIIDQKTKTQEVNLASDNIIKNQTSKTYDLEYMTKNPVDIGIKRFTKDPQVLILHTHGTESYTKSDDDKYLESGDKRTLDEEYNVIKVGQTIEQILNKNNIKTLHAKDLNDYPSYSGSYDRSREVIEKYLKEYPSIKMVIDIHRDAMITDEEIHYRPVTTIDGEKTAQLMFVVGTDEGGLSHDGWQDNLNFVYNFQNYISGKYDDFMRPINLRSSRFNQHATKGSMLLEVGASGNTLKEAINAAEIFATELAAYLK